MFSVVICDDENAVCAQLERMILSCRETLGVPMEVEVFYSGEELCAYLDRGEHPDLIFLDIELPLLSGLDVAKKIRQAMRNESIQIVYISAKQEYAMELFETRPLNFLVKPLLLERVFHELKKALELKNRSLNYFEFSIKGRHYRIPLGSIVYFESIGRQIRLREKCETGFEIWEFHGTLQKVQDQLAERDFILIHRSYLVNNLHIAGYFSQSVILQGGQTLPIGQTYRRSVQETFLKRRRDAYDD